VSSVAASAAHPNADVRLAAAALAAELGPEAADAVPALLRQSCVDRLPHVRYAMLRALDAIDPTPEECVAVLVHLLEELPKDEPDDPHGFGRSLAAWGIGRMGAAAATGAGVAVLTRIAADADDHGDPRYAAGWALARLAPASLPALPTLMRLVQADDDASMRSIAAEALGALGGDAEQAVPVLADALADPSPLVREDAARALGRIGADAAVSVPALARALDDPDQLTREFAVESLSSFPDDGHAVAPLLVEQLRDGSPTIRRKAAQSLGRVGAGEAGAALRRVTVRDPDRHVRDAARRATADIPPGEVDHTGFVSEEELSLLLERLRTAEDGRIRAGTTWRIATWGPAVAELAPDFARQLEEDDHSDARWAAAWALGRLRASDPRAIDALARAARRDPDPDNRAEAVRALGWIGPWASAAVPALRDALDDHYGLVRAEARTALALVEPDTAAHAGQTPASAPHLGVAS